MKTLIIITNSLKPSAIDKLIMADIYNEGHDFDKIVIVVNSKNKEENLHWWSVFYRKSIQADLIFQPQIFAWLRNNISLRLFRHTKTWDLKIALLLVSIMSRPRYVKVVNYDFSRALPSLLVLNRLIQIELFHEVHNLTWQSKHFIDSYHSKYVFAATFQIDYYTSIASDVLKNNFIYKPYKPLDPKSFENAIDYGILYEKLSVKSIKNQVLDFCKEHRVNLIYYGRFIDFKGLKELCEVVKSMAEKYSVGLSLFGEEHDWFLKWFKDYENYKAIRNFHGPYVDVELLLPYFDYNCILSESEVGPLTVYEAACFGKKSLVRDRPYAHREEFKDHVIVLDDKQFNNLERSLIDIFKKNDVLFPAQKN